MTQAVTKSPSDHLDFDVDFSQWLPFEDRITSIAAQCDNGTASVTLTEYSDTVAKVWIEGGTDGETNDVTITVQTLNGRVKTFHFQLKIRKGC